MQLQDQIYILSGVFAGALLMLFIAVLIQFYWINHISKDFKNHKSKFNSNYAYTNPQILQNEELSRRGFSQHGGNVSNFPPKIERFVSIKIRVFDKFHQIIYYYYSVDQSMYGRSPQPDYQMGNNSNFGWQQAPPSHSNSQFENASKDFTKIINNDNLLFGGDIDDREHESDRKRSNLKNKGYPPQPSIMNKMRVKSSQDSQKNNPNDPKSYYNNRAINVY
jgi:hypothetical protein